MTEEERKVRIQELEERIESINFRLSTYRNYVSPTDIEDGYTVSKLYNERKACWDELNKLTGY